MLQACDGGGGALAEDVGKGCVGGAGGGGGESVG